MNDISYLFLLLVHLPFLKSPLFLPLFIRFVFILFLFVMIAGNGQARSYSNAKKMKTNSGESMLLGDVQAERDSLKVSRACRDNSLSCNYGF